MQEKESFPEISMHITRGFLVVPIQGELYDSTLSKIQTRILKKVTQKGVKGIVMDVSGANLIDVFLGKTILSTVRMASLLGAKTVLTGIKPETIVSLMDFDFEFEGIPKAITLEEGFKTLEMILKQE